MDSTLSNRTPSLNSRKSLSHDKRYELQQNGNDWPLPAGKSANFFRVRLEELVFYIVFAAGSFGVWENASEFQDLQYSKTPSSESNGLEL